MFIPPTREEEAAQIYLAYGKQMKAEGKRERSKEIAARLREVREVAKKQATVEESAGNEAEALAFDYYALQLYLLADEIESECG
jgi:hypothetical protein